MLTCVIVDHDKASLKNAEFIVKEITHLKLIQSCKTIKEAIDVLQNNKTDILFIGMDGISMDDLHFLNSLNYDRPYIIAMASDIAAAKDAFDIDAVDFILKPVTSQRLLAALSKVLNTSPLMIQETQVADNEFFIKQNSHFLKINMKDICHIEALADYINLYTKTNRYTIHSTMKGIHSRLPEKEFARVHKSYIVRVDKISKIEGKSLKVENHTIPVSNSFRKAFFEQLNVL